MLIKVKNIFAKYIHIIANKLNNKNKIITNTFTIFKPPQFKSIDGRCPYSGYDACC